MNAPRVDRHSDTWRCVNERAKEMLDRARLVTEAHGVDMPDTEFARGQIAALRAIQSLGAPPKG